MSQRSVLVIALLALVLAACGSAAPAGTASGGATAAPAAGGGDIIVGLITKTETNPFFVKMREGAQKEADAKGVKLMTAAGKNDGDNASQVTAIENMITAGVKGILLVPSDTKAIIPTVKKARDKGVFVITLDTPLDPQDAADALFATDNFKAGVLIGQYAKAAMAGKPAKIATLDLAPGITVGVLRHNGFMSGFGLPGVDPKVTNQQATDPSIVCSQDTQGDQAKGQTAMENCLQKSPDINLVYTINEPAAAGAYTALKAAGKDKDVIIVSVDGGCAGVKNVQAGVITATSQQYPLKMAVLGVDAIVDFAKNGTKASGYTDTGVTLIASKPQAGVDSKDVQFGLDNCWG
jgi:fructose transport system substrate-binding protein